VTNLCPRFGRARDRVFIRSRLDGEIGGRCCRRSRNGAPARWEKELKGSGNHRDGVDRELNPVATTAPGGPPHLKNEEDT
jgi:hypothetical protein